ncbi:MAG: APC family permease [Metamycoplasmataceae bacterium]
MEIKNVRKLGFFSALTICIGSVVGIGIFFKNASIQGFNQNDGVSWLLSWILGGFIALLVAIHFGKLSKVKLDNDDTGLAGWANYYTKPKEKWFSKLVSLNYSLFYNSLLFVILIFLTGETVVEFIYNAQGLDHKEFPVYGIVIISLAFGIVIFIVNYLSTKFVGIASQVTTIIKFIPLIIVIMSGMILFNSHHLEAPNGNLGGNGFENSISPGESFQGILISLPAVLFAFDNFVGVGVLGDRFKGGEKTVSKVIFIGMIGVIIIYVLVAVSSILHSVDGIPSFIANVIQDIFGGQAGRILNIFLSLIIFISVFGTTMAVNAVCLKEFQNIVRKKVIYKTNWWINKFGENKTVIIFYSVVIGFWSLLIYLPASILNNDQIVDGFSNYPVILFFLVYIILIFFYWKNDYLPNQENKSKKIIYSIFVIFTLFAISVVISVNVILSVKEAIVNPLGKISWGLYFTNGIGISNLGAIIFYLFFILFFFATPFINDYFVRKAQLK